MSFDLARLYGEIDAERQQRGLTWSGLAREVHVATATIRRWQKASDAEADGVLALVRWLGVPPETFGAPTCRSKVLPAGAGFVRVDTQRIAAALDEPAIAKRSRQTIQQLVNAAQTCDRSIASLTRLSEI